MKLIRVALFTFLSLGCGPILLAQQDVGLDASVVSDSGVTSVRSTPALENNSELPAENQSAYSGPAKAQDENGDDGHWHFAVSPYLWLPGAHGTVGAFGRNVGFKASAGDLLSHARFALLAAGEARRDRLLTTVDFLYMRLGADKAIPLPPILGATSANFIANIVILTPKVGVRVIDEEKLKADFLAGVRYWHLGKDVSFTPSVLGLNFSRGQNFVDPLVGGRIAATLTPKTVFTLAGDVGGWGAASQIDYQVVGLLGYKLTHCLILQGGYRYLYVDYEKTGPSANIFKAALSGVVLGVTINLK